MRSVGSVLVLTCGAVTALAQTQGPRPEGGEVEDIYIVRSMRTSRVEPTPYCSHQRVALSGVTFEDQYTFYSVATRPTDGLITKAAENAIGHLRACISPTADPLVVNFYGEGGIGDVSFTVFGDCRAPALDQPEPGATFYSCSFKVKDLPEPYVGGHLTTSTILSRATIGAVSDPPGYVQPSIATIRLWKRR